MSLQIPSTFSVPGSHVISGFTVDSLAEGVVSLVGVFVIIDSTGDGVGNTLDYPLGMAVDSSGNVYVAGNICDNAFKITSAGLI